jgi:hypothetical protein
MKVINNELHINTHAAQFFGLCLFLTGMIFSLTFRPEPINYAEFTERLNTVEYVCERPQKGKVIITASDVLDAVRGKPLEFVVNTKIEG